MTDKEQEEKKPVGMKAGKRYKCAKCGTEALVTKPGQGPLRCCGEEMAPK